jgi:tRNA threonylcarbamoyladenosine biosynthesis protein TsaB
LDAASTLTQVGLLRENLPPLWRQTAEEAGRGMFVSTQGILSDSGLQLDDIEAFIFCEGPGSMLGVRTVAMALRTWITLKPRAIYSYQSLTIAASAQWHESETRSFSIVADARRDTWHVQSIDANGRLSPLRRVLAIELPSGDLFTPENFRAWSKPPRPIGHCSYDLARLFTTLKDEDIFRVTDAPDAFQHEAPDYKKWSAVIHSNETVIRK